MHTKKIRTWIQPPTSTKRFIISVDLLQILINGQGMLVLGVLIDGRQKQCGVAPPRSHPRKSSSLKPMAYDHFSIVTSGTASMEPAHDASFLGGGVVRHVPAFQ